MENTQGANASPNKPSSGGLFSRFKDGATKSLNNIGQNISGAVSQLKYKYILSEETEETYKEVYALLKEEFKDLEYSSLDMFFGMMLLSTYYKTNTDHTGKVITDPLVWGQGAYYMKFASGAYGWPLYYLGKGFGKEQFKGIASGTKDSDKTNCETLYKHTGLTENDILLISWTSDNFNPGHFVALNHANKEIIVAIRGTFHVHDALTDLTGRNEPFMGGFAHSGMLRTATKKKELFLPLLADTLKQYPDYKIIVTGHSLGAGTAAILTILLVQEHPEWPIMGYCFAPPCIISLDISLKYTDKIISYNNDVIPRSSLASLEAVKNAIVQLLSQSDNNLQRMYYVVNAGNNFGEDVSKKISGFLKVKETPDWGKVNTRVANAEHLVPPGKIYHIYKVAKMKKDLMMEESVHEFFTEVVIANDMFTDHLPLAYEAAFKTLMSTDMLL